MKLFVQFTAAVLFFSVLFSCQKSPNDLSLTPEERQKISEQQHVLLLNEMLENEGLRFKLNYVPGSAEIGLRLFKVSPVRSEIALDVTHEFLNYTIESKALANNSDYILMLEYKSVAQAGSFDLEVIGFTSMNLSKEFTLSNNSYVPANSGTTRDFLKIRKGVAKFSFYKL